MGIVNYTKGFLRNLFNKRISSLALVDHYSTFAKSSKIYRGVKMIRSQINEYSYIAPRTQVLYAKIGKYCSVGPDCLIGLPLHSIDNISTSPIFNSKNNALKIRWTDNNSFEEFKEVRIGNDVWIGSRAIILGGVKIGDGAVIATGAIVTKDVPAYAIVAGIPAKTIRYRFESDIIEKLLELKWWDWDIEKIKKNMMLFNEMDISKLDLNSLR